MTITKPAPVVCLVAVLAAGVLFWMATSAKPRSAEVMYSQFLQQVRSGAVETVTISSNNQGSTPATFRTKNGGTAHTVLPSDYQDAVRTMQEQSVNIDIQESSNMQRLLTNSIPFIVMLGVWFVMVVKLKGSSVRIA